MIAGLATHRSVEEQSSRPATICADESFTATQRELTPTERSAVDTYCEIYRATFGFYPHGLHYIPFAWQDESAAVWLPIP